MSGHREVEREIKLAAPDHFRLPPLTDPGGGIFSAAAETVVLDATYFDTEDLRLARAGASLRHRSDDGWTVKLPLDESGGEGLARTEHHCAGAPWAPPEAARDLVRALARSAPLAEVARLRSTRERVRVHDAEGRQIAEVVDDQVVASHGAVTIGRFREVEIELGPTLGPHQRATILARLRAAGAGAAEPLPKLVRALGPRAAAPPDVVVERPDGPDVAATLRFALADAVDRLVHHDPGVRLGEHPEDVHQARVATRRLRSHLRTFGSLLDERWADELRDELGWLADLLGGVRDAEVLRDRLRAKVERLAEADRPPVKRLIDVLDEERDERREVLLAAMRSPRYDELLERLVGAARRPRLLLRVDDDSDEEVLRRLARVPYRRLRRAVEELGENPPDRALHETRIRAKRARYAIEAVEPVFAKPAHRLARAIARLQDVLGEHQDAVVATDWVRAAAARTDDDAATFAAGQLAALEHLDALAARAAWRARWDEASSKSLRAWL